MLRALHQGCQGLLRVPGLYGTAYYSVQIVVPALGDSISDGTIASVLKKSGDAVAENETIAQIETDKVTIDIKAPADGTILGIVVQEQDTVVPGQLVATIDDSAAMAKLVGATPPPQPSAQQHQQPQPAAPAVSSAAPAQEAAAAGPTHRIPGIRFPPRRTADGRRISLLPAAEATSIIEQWKKSATTTTAGTSAPAPAAAAAGASLHDAAAVDSDSADSSAFAAWAAAQRRQQQEQQAADRDAPSKFATSVTRLQRMPARRELSDRDMELIELGGAAP